MWLYWIAHQIYALMVGSGKIARKTSLFRIKGIVIAGVRYYLFNMSHLLVTKGGFNLGFNQLMVLYILSQVLYQALSLMLVLDQLVPVYLL
jgi:hypothetical protein